MSAWAQIWIELPGGDILDVIDERARLADALSYVRRAYPKAALVLSHWDRPGGPASVTEPATRD
jgi:hypothetical protein